MEIVALIPLFNGIQWIRQTLESVFSQSKLPTEVLVVEDGSEDGSPEIAQSLAGVRVLTNLLESVKKDN